MRRVKMGRRVLPAWRKFRSGKGSSRSLAECVDGDAAEDDCEVSLGLAAEGVFAAEAWAHGGDFGAGHGTEEGEDASGDPDGSDHA
jgi:hypothetical protein